MYRNLKACLLLFVISYLLLVTSPVAQAQTMSNKDYIIKMQGFNTLSGVTAGKDYNLRSTVGDNALTSEGVNFKVKTGFENLAATVPFSISLSSNLVDFGTLSPTNPIIRTVDLSINSLAAYGYSVLVFENEPLTTIPPTASNSATASKSFIPDTTCDFGACGTENAAAWTNALTYGFGYRCDSLTRLPSPGGKATGGQAGADCDSSFAKTNAYKHFPDIANNDDPLSVMAGVGANNKVTRISYKINISGTQAQGIYSNIITYIAVPNY